MSTSRPGTTERRAELRADMEARIQRQRQRPLPGWLSTRSNRRVLALAPLLILVLGAVAAGLRDDTSGVVLMLVAVLLGTPGTLLLRRATRMLDAAPEGLLDEREIGERNQAYRRGFSLTLALLGTLFLLAVVDGFLVRTSAGPLFGGDGWIHLTLTAFLVASMLPAAALAWRWQAPVDDPDDLDD